ncbi:MAG TPA: amidohydrolase, partial [Phycisphaerales bacterium]|nr:amidohydrolase [Phycisphaerales bacterium]
IEGVSAALNEMSCEMLDSPEVGMAEFRASRRQADLLVKWGFDVRIPYCGMETAFRAEIGSGGPVFCVMSEYDALPEIGHACGHNLISVSALSAAAGVSELIKSGELPGTFVVLGSPGEEGKGGKIHLMNAGAFDGVGAAMMAHPGWRTATWKGCFGLERFEVEYVGKASHAGTAPEKGINALEGVMALFHGMNAWRQHLPEETRVHGIITDGGSAANVVPARAVARIYLRSGRQGVLDEMVVRFGEMVEGAALLSGTKVNLRSEHLGYKSGFPNEPLNREFFDAATELGMNPEMAEKQSRGSTDFGNVSRILPGSHVYFGISADGSRLSLHTEEFEKASRSEFAFNSALKAGEALASVACRYLSDETYRAEVAADFAK